MNFADIPENLMSTLFDICLGRQVPRVADAMEQQETGDIDKMERRTQEYILYMHTYM